MFVIDQMSPIIRRKYPTPAALYSVRNGKSCQSPSDGRIRSGRARHSCCTRGQVLSSVGWHCKRRDSSRASRRRKRSGGLKRRSTS